MMVTLEAVGEILQEEDIEGFLALGAPRDEYAHEAAEIHAALVAVGQKPCNHRDLSALVAEVWDHSFGPFGADEMERRRPVLDRVVERLLTHTAAESISVQRQARVEERL